MSKQKDHTILSSSAEDGIDRSVVSLMQEKFGARSVSITTKGESIQTLTVPRSEFRRALQKDSTLRAIVRASATNIQDVHVKPLSLGEVMEAKVYVKDAKAVGASRRDGSNIALGDSIARLHETLSEWGQIRIPALVLLLIAGGTLYGAYRLAKVATDMGQDYAKQLGDASASEVGLERAIKARSGRRPPETTPENALTDSASTENSTSHPTLPNSSRPPEPSNLPTSPQ
ncbi:MAG: hypothetical protein J0M12_01220 [Deltaproteobacteria bacterium]|nr:hypothetical protein [Deltaproteobacteria bacterium]